MAKVRFKDTDIVLEVEAGTRLSDCIRMTNNSIETPCSCMGLCGKCAVKVQGDLEEPTLEEKRLLKGAAGIRLACLAIVKGDVEIELIKKNRILKTISKAHCIEVEVQSEIKKERLPKINNSNCIPYEEIINKNIVSLNLLEKIATLEKSNPEIIYGVTYKETLLDIDENIEKILGISIDIGTTGISAYLIDLENGEIVNKKSCLNPQIEFGGDVLSRIAYSISNEEGTRNLKNSILNKINEIARELVEEDFNLENIYRICIAANTTMLHLFAGINPGSLAKAPYRSVFLNKRDINASDLGIQINNNGIITLLPSASSYVGADILAGIAAIDFYKKGHCAIFIDIGTNGEIAVISKGKLAATSTAAGPALEGMNISCGCRAEDGAIDTLDIDENNNINFSVIGNVKPIGICGSGIIDIAASLVKREIVLPNGRFNKNLPDKISSRFKDKKLYITEDIFISQTDIRQIQLAKGAISAGMSMLLEELHISPDEVKEVVIAGAFGYHINSESIVEIGLIPKGFKGRINFVGNSSLEGARLALINKEMLNKMEDIKEKMEIMELSTKENFQDYFIRALSF